MARKNIMRRFRMGEISSVDRPAQPGARAVLLKRDDSSVADPPDPRYSPSNDDSKGEMLKKEKQMEKDLEKALAKIAALEENLTKRDADLARANSIVALSAPHRAHFDSLSKAEQDAFLTMDGNARDRQIELVKNADPVVYTTTKGIEIRKSAGEQVLQMAKDADEALKTAAESAKLVKDADITKRANEDLGNLAGDEKIRKAVVAALDTIEDEAVRKGAFAAVKSANTAAAEPFKKKGSSDNGNTDDGGETPLEKLNKLATTEAAASKVTFEKAMDKVLQTQEGQKLYAESQRPKAA